MVMEKKIIPLTRQSHHYILYTMKITICQPQIVIIDVDTYMAGGIFDRISGGRQKGVRYPVFLFKLRS